MTRLFSTGTSPSRVAVQVYVPACEYIIEVAFALAIKFPKLVWKLSVTNLQKIFIISCNELD